MRSPAFETGDPASGSYHRSEAKSLNPAAISLRSPIYVTYRTHPFERAGAHDEIGELLRSAIPSAEDAPLDDATRRLMLQLSIEPLEGPAQPVAPEIEPRRRSLLDRMLHPQANTAP